MDTRKRLAGAVTIGAVGALTAVVQVFHASELDASLLTDLYGVLLPLALSGLLVVGGGWLVYRDGETPVLRTAGWTLAGAAVVATVGVLTVQYQRTQGVEMARPLFVVANNATGGATLGFLLGVYDARRRQAIGQLAAERRRAERLGRRHSILNRVLRHDLRNDVNVVRGYAEMLADGKKRPVGGTVDATAPAGGQNAREQAETPARIIVRKVDDMLRLTENVRQLGRLFETDTPTTTTVDAAEVVEARVETAARVHPSARIDTDLPESAWVDASPLLRSAVDNLIGNAIGHSDRAEPTVEVSVAVAGDAVEIRVADDGPGIPDEEIRALEGKETQLEHSSGLGLWLVTWIARASDGTVQFDDREPRGSVVALSVPRVQPPD